MAQNPRHYGIETNLHEYQLEERLKGKAPLVHDLKLAQTIISATLAVFPGKMSAV